MIGSGIYLVLLGRGRNLAPIRFRGSQDAVFLGLATLFLGALLLPTCFGFSFSEIRDVLEDIWSTGGGVGTG